MNSRFYLILIYGDSSKIPSIGCNLDYKTVGFVSSVITVDLSYSLIEERLSSLKGASVIIVYMWFMRERWVIIGFSLAD